MRNMPLQSVEFEGCGVFGEGWEWEDWRREKVRKRRKRREMFGFAMERVRADRKWGRRREG